MALLLSSDLELQAAQRDQLVAELRSLIKNGVKLFAHRVILSARCAALQALVATAKPRLDNVNVLEISVEFTSEIFKLVLEFLYTGWCTLLSDAAAIGVLSPAKRYALCVLTAADMWNAEELCDICCSFVEQHSEKMFDGDHYLALSPNAFLRVLVRNALKLNEIDIFRAVVKWAQSRADAAADPATLVASVAPGVRFPLMDFEELTNIVEPTKLVPSELLKEAYRVIARPDAKDSAATTAAVATADSQSKAALLSPAPSKVSSPATAARSRTSATTPHTAATTATPVSRSISREPASPIAEQSQAAVFDAGFLTAQRRVSRAGGLKRVKVVFDRACKSRHIQLLDAHTACSADESGMFGLRGLHPITERRSCFEIVVEALDRDAMVSVGVVDDSVDVGQQTNGGDQPGGYVYQSNTAAIQSGRSRLFGRPFGAGDAIGVTVDHELHTVAFSKNGQSLGAPFLGIPAKVYPFVALGRNARVRARYPES